MRNLSELSLLVEMLTPEMLTGGDFPAAHKHFGNKRFEAPLRSAYSRRGSRAAHPFEEPTGARLSAAVLARPRLASERQPAHPSARSTVMGLTRSSLPIARSIAERQRGQALARL